jgi:hypothetical protein
VQHHGSAWAAVFVTHPNIASVQQIFLNLFESLHAKRSGSVVGESFDDFKQVLHEEVPCNPNPNVGDSLGNRVAQRRPTYRKEFVPRALLWEFGAGWTTRGTALWRIAVLLQNFSKYPLAIADIRTGWRR